MKGSILGALCFNGEIYNYRSLRTELTEKYNVDVFVAGGGAAGIAAAVAAARGEIGKEKFKWTLLFWIVVSYLTSTIVYTVGEYVWPVAIWAAVAVLAVVGISLYAKRANKKDAEKRLLNARK